MVTEFLAMASFKFPCSKRSATETPLRSSDEAHRSPSNRSSHGGVPIRLGSTDRPPRGNGAAATIGVPPRSVSDQGFHSRGGNTFSLPSSNNLTVTPLSRNHRSPEGLIAASRIEPVAVLVASSRTGLPGAPDFPTG